jgi:F420-0:gamma-glutamyl ligase
MSLKAKAIQTSIFKRGEDLIPFLIDNLNGEELENTVLAVTSKIISIAEGQLISPETISKADLVKKEADHWLGIGGYGVELTIKHGLLIPSAGIDESNSQNGDYILFPQNPYASAQKIWQALKNHFQLDCFGVVITDSHTLPMRLGVTGVALAHWGFKATKSYVGQEDIFGRKLKFTYIDLVDALAGVAVLLMGEGQEQQPLALVSGIKLEYTTHSEPSEVSIELEKDLYYPMLKALLPPQK